MGRDPGVVQGEGGDCHSTRVLERLYHFVETSLLKSLHIICCLVTGGKFVLVKIKFVPTGKSYQFV